MTWRPLPPEEPPDPRPVGASLEVLARRLGAARPAALGAVFGRWSEVVGDPLASQARPVALARGVLTVEVDDPAVATHVRFLAPQLLARLADVSGGPVADRVDVRVMPSRPQFRPR